MLKAKRISVGLCIIIALIIACVMPVGLTAVKAKNVAVTSNPLDWFAENHDSSRFDDDLCALMADLACAAYNRQEVKDMYRSLDFEVDNENQFKTLNNGANDAVPIIFGGGQDTTLEYSIGIKKTFDGNNLVLIDIRGSRTKKDWYRDFNFVSGYGAYSYHSGFNEAANRVLTDLDIFFPDANEQTYYYVTGHSLGAAMGNLVSAKLNARFGSGRVFSYNFACPNTTIIDSSVYHQDNLFNMNNAYSNIFNICDANDIITKLPPSAICELIQNPVRTIKQGFVSDSKWGKLGITKWFDGGLNALFTSHEPERYRNYVKQSEAYYIDSETCPKSFPVARQNNDTSNNSDDSDPLSPTYKGIAPFTTVMTFCPVDIEITDESGKVVAYTENHIPYYNDYDNDLFIMTFEDRKCILYPKDSESNYSIRMHGTDQGEMLVLLGESYGDEIENIKTFDNVSLYEGKQMSIDVVEDDITSSKLYVDDSEGEAVKEIHKDGAEAKIGVTDLDIKTIIVEQDENDFVIKPGSTKQIKTVFQNADGDIIEKASIWTSSDEEIATVSETGLVTAVSEGSAMITVSVDGKSMDILVTVSSKQEEPPVEPDDPSTTNNPTAEPDNSSDNTQATPDKSTPSNLNETDEDISTESDAKLNGIVKGPDGKWAMYKNNKIDTSYTGIAKNQYGWWRIEKGYVNFKANGIYKNQYGWWKTTDGKVTFKETGVFKNEYGWWRVENSKVNFKADGIYKNQYGWWKTNDGKVTFKETGVFKNEYGWWRVKDSKVDFKAQGIYQNKYGWWKTTNGKVTFKENGVFQNEYGWWKVKDSKVDFSFTGIAKNKYGFWYVKDGKVDFKKNGKVNYNNHSYIVKSGKVQ